MGVSDDVNAQAQMICDKNERSSITNQVRYKKGNHINLPSSSTATCREEGRKMRKRENRRIRTFVVTSVGLPSYELIVHIRGELLELLAGQAGELLTSS